MNTNSNNNNPSRREFQLSDPPTDGISHLQFSNQSPNLLVVTSWDTSVRIYNIKENKLIQKYHHSSSVLCATFSLDDKYILSGGIDCTLIKYNLQTNEQTTIGITNEINETITHKKAIKCILTIPNQPNLLITGSWDCNVKVWDIDKNILIQNINLDKKIYSMDISPDGNKLVVGTQDLMIYVFQVRNNNLKNPLKLLFRKNSGLKYQTRCIKCFKDNTGYATSSIEGRVSIEYFDDTSKSYAFKCHRSTTNGGVETLFPVNTIAFHPVFGTFATGGCDNIVNIWDRDNKKRICQYRSYDTSIASLSFNSTGEYLAIAVSYTWELGNKEHPVDKIYIREVMQSDVSQKKL
ncbi:hypothetical protein ABK040_005664 [Willaertia magna]